MAIEIVSCPIKNGDFPSFFVGLPGRVNVTSVSAPSRAKSSYELGMFHCLFWWPEGQRVTVTHFTIENESKHIQKKLAVPSGKLT